MHLNIKLQRKWDEILENLRFRLARPDALLPLAFLSLLTGFLAGGVIVLFRFLIEGSQDALLPDIGSENYEGLTAGIRFLFPTISGFLLALLFYKYSKGIRVLGIARVMERMAYHQGYMTIRGFFIQFIGAGIAIIGGHSVGREGPHAYLGATISSLFGQFFKLPNNSIRTLVASGAAAGIAASFNTPLAGVIFALEVIMMEYTLSSFIPVMLSTVVATALSNAVLGSEPAFVVPVLEVVPLTELPIVLVLGLAIGSFAALFNHALTTISVKSQSIEIWWRISAAGVLVGLLGSLQPEILGIGYDTVNASLLGNFALGSFLVLALLKLLATSVSVGLGVPGGMIGPAFFIGATLGGAFGLMASWIYGDSVSYVGFYVLLGMGAMMGASLQAPLAALTAIMELTYNPGIIMPGMLVIVVAQLTASELFNKQSLFVSMLRSNGLDYSIDPVLQVLRSVGVASILDNDVSRHQFNTTYSAVEPIINSANKWLIIDDENNDIKALMPITELAKHIYRDELIGATVDADALEYISSADKNADIDKPINLLEIPAKRLNLAPISLQANLMEAYEAFESGIEALYVVFQVGDFTANSRVYGIITPQMIEEAYVPKTTKTLS